MDNEALIFFLKHLQSLNRTVIEIDLVLEHLEDKKD